MDPTDILDNAALTTNAAVAAGIALALRDPSKTKVLTLSNGIPLLISQEGLTLQSHEHLLPAPKRPTIHVALYTRADLLDYITNQAIIYRPAPADSEATDPAIAPAFNPPADRTVIFANRQDLSFHAIIGYHQPGLPSWCSHTARVKYQHSHQFGRWKGMDGKKMSQEDFATFLDENVSNIIEPTGAEVVTFAANLEVTRTERFKSSRNLNNGQVAFTFTNEAGEGQSEVKFPTEMTLSIPIWINGDTIAIKAKLFYRMSEGKLTFWYKLMMLEETIDHLFNEDVEWLRSATRGIATLYQGLAPEKPCALSLD